jgi:hypothetical protein
LNLMSKFKNLLMKPTHCCIFKNVQNTQNFSMR